MGSDQNFVFNPDSNLQIKEETEICKPKMYRVILHNDHYTTMEFVVEILVKIFHKPAQEASRVMRDVHRRGSGQCGVYSLDIARTKVSQVHTLAKQHDFPLRCSYEEA
jgi:ATP-dependent Clp protease adaptor protein ClpS